MPASESKMATTRLWTVVAVALLAVGTSSCSSNRLAAVGTRVIVVEHDFGISTAPAQVPAGLVTLHIENRGPSTHELILDRTPLESESLPLRRNGLQVDESDEKLTVVSSLTAIRVGTSRDLTVWLVPGHYVLFCNLEGHYLGGMRLTIQVKE
jgi:uncharacterized cupredoxin-like copper-binding protein